MGNIYNSCRLPLRMKLAGMLLMGSISMGYGITERRQSASLFIEVNNESVQNVLKEIECQSEYSFSSEKVIVMHPKFMIGLTRRVIKRCVDIFIT